MAGGAVNLLYNTIYANYYDVSFQPWSPGAEMMIIYYSASFALYQPMIITKSFYDQVASYSPGAGYMELPVYELNNGSITQHTAIRIYAKNYNHASDRYTFSTYSDCWCMLVGNS